MGNKNTFWIGSEFYYPEINYASGYFLTGIAENLTSLGNVNVVCSSPNTSNGIPVFSETINNVNIIRLKAPDLDKNKILQRIFRFIVISFRFLILLLRKVKTGDTLIIVTNPAPLIIIAAIIKLIRRCNFVIIVHDVFPENLIATGLLKSQSIIYRLLLRLFNWAYSKADKLITLGRDMEDHFQNKLPDFKGVLCCIQNWGDPDKIFPDHITRQNLLNAFDLKDKFIFQYAGNLGRAQGIPYILKAAAELTDTSAHFMFFGEGLFTKDVKESAVKYKNITYGGIFSRSEAQKYLNACDISIITLLDGIAGLGVPSKTYDILAAGKPVLFIGEKKSEIARMIEEEKIGLVVNPNSSDEICRAVNYFMNMNEKELHQMQINARNVLVEKYSKDKILEKYRTIIVD